MRITINRTPKRSPVVASNYSPRSVFRRRFVFLIVSCSRMPILLTKRRRSSARSCSKRAIVGVSSPFFFDGSMRRVNGKRSAWRFAVQGITLTTFVGVSAAMIAGRRPYCSWPFTDGNSTIHISPFFIGLISRISPFVQMLHR